jgi:carboxyl-terminal processing protease
MLAMLIAVLTIGSLSSVALSQKKDAAAPAEKVENETPVSPQQAREDLYSQIELFSYVLTTVQSEYVDEQKPKDLIYGSLKGMLAGLDPHSQFLTPEDYEDLKTETKGAFGGLGIEISIRDGLLTVITPIEDTPAWNAGLKAGDRIVKIEEELTKDFTLSEAVKMLRGEPGTDVHITVLREDEFKIHEFTITREIIHIQDVKDVHMVSENVGYIRLTEFRQDSAQEFEKSLRSLRDQGANALIVDLRNNPGGLLNVAIRISEMFLPYGETVVSTKGRHAAQDSISKSTNRSKEFLDWPVVVLINEGSASGSEIFAGALKDNKRGVVLGTKSFGKGSVQSVIPLPDGSGLRLTTSKYFTPSGVSIHGTGIEPDIEVKRIAPPTEEEAEKSKDVEKIFADIEHKDDNPEELEKLNAESKLKKRMLEDNQVQAAISVIKGIRVYKSQQPEAAKTGTGTNG